MESRIARKIHLQFYPVAVLFSDEKPVGALQFKEGSHGCVVAMLTQAAQGKVAVFDRHTAGCLGGGVGLCFGDTYGDFPGGIEYFLSVGRPGYRAGEGYRKTVELAAASVASLPKVDIPYAYVVFKPLQQVDPAEETPQLVCFYCNSDQLSALVTLANYDRPGRENVVLPAVSGCQSVVLVPYLESQKEQPRAVVGMTDISARPHVDPGILTFTVPFRRFLELEANLTGSFFDRAAWNKLQLRIPEVPTN